MPNLIWAQNPLKIYCIDVNQGSSTLIISPTNKYVLIDAGDSIFSYNYGDTVIAFLRNLGITHLDYMIATHYHTDHIGGFPKVIYGLSYALNNDSIYEKCYDRGDSNNPTNVWYTKYITATGSKRCIIGLGDTLQLGAGAFMVCVVRNGKIVNGDSVLSNTGENYRSIGFVLKYGLFEFFIGGDLVGKNVSGERDVETKVAPIIRNVDVYVANHHGSGNSSNQTFLDSLRPEVAIISQGTANGHPHQEALDRLAAHNAYIYQMNDNPDGGTIPSGHGRILNTTAVITVDNIKYIVNGDTYPIDGVRRDGTVLEILSPKDTIAEGTIVTPTARIENLGNITESFKLRLKIGGVYNKTKTISNLAPNDIITVAFDTTWTAVRGNYQVKCSTEVPQDLDSTNDRKTANLTVAFYDAELKEIVVPVVNDTFFTNESIVPKVIVKDNSEFSYPSLVKVYCRIRCVTTIYLDSVQRTLVPGNSDTIVFTKKSLSGVNEGIYTCSTWVVRILDLVPSNNVKFQQFVIKTLSSNIAWRQLDSLPGLRGVKSGGALVAGTQDKIYAFEGNNTRGFYAYYINGDSWSRKESIPDDPLNRKRVGKGAALAYNKFSHPDIIYATKGNNTLEFWAYDVEADSWYPKTKVPTNSIKIKKVKGGAGIAFLKRSNQTYVYLLKGNRTTEFYGYHCQADTWMTHLDSAPRGIDSKPFKDGSCITTGHDNKLYVLKGGAKYNEFYCYDVAADTWIELESIPRYSPLTGKKSKIKDGAALCYNDDSLIYAFKGGNRQEFWQYNINQNRWTELDTIPRGPRKKKVGGGGALTYTNNKVYALNGNRTFEFWQYTPFSGGVESKSSPYVSDVKLQVQGDNLNTLDEKITASVKLYNISGQLVDSREIKNYLIKDLDKEFKDVKPGVYFIHITDSNKTISTKLIKIH